MSDEELQDQFSWHPLAPPSVGVTSPPSKPASTQVPPPPSYSQLKHEDDECSLNSSGTSMGGGARPSLRQAQSAAPGSFSYPVPPPLTNGGVKLFPAAGAADPEATSAETTLLNRPLLTDHYPPPPQPPNPPPLAFNPHQASGGGRGGRGLISKFAARRSQSLRTPRDIPRVPFYRQPKKSGKRGTCTAISIEDNTLLSAPDSAVIDVPTPTSAHGSPVRRHMDAALRGIGEPSGRSCSLDCSGGPKRYDSVDLRIEMNPAGATGGGHYSDDRMFQATSLSANIGKVRPL